MLLPNKYLAPEDSILGISVTFLARLPAASPIGEAWFLFRSTYGAKASYLRFTLALDVLYALSLIRDEGNMIVKVQKNAS